MEARAEFAEEAARQHPVASHRIEQTAAGGLRGDARSELRDDKGSEENRAEEVPADALGDLKRRGIGVLEDPAGMDELHCVGHDDEDASADEGDEHDRLRHGATRVDGLLGEGGDGVEAEERICGDRGTAADGHERGIDAGERGRADQSRTAIRGEYIGQGEGDEEDDDEDLKRHEDEVDPIGDLDAYDIEHRGEDDEADDPHGHRHGRELRLQVGAADEPDDHRQEEVIEHRGPADEESDAAIDRLAYIRVGRSGNRVGRSHPAIAVGSEEHRAECQEVGARARPIRL